MIRLACLVAVWLPVSVFAQQGADIRIKLRTKDERKGRPIDQDAALRLDATARRLSVVSKNDPRELGFDDVQRVLIEPDSHAGDIGLGAAIAGFAAGGLLFGGKIATSIDKPLQADHVVYVEPRGPAAQSGPLVIVLEKEAAPAGLRRIKELFTDRVVVPVFDETPERVDKKQFDRGDAYLVKGHATEHPLPAVRPDKAVVLVAASVGGSFRPANTKKAEPFHAKILVNEKVVAANAPGTYTFFELDPGEHFLVSQAMVDKKSVDVTGLRIKVEAGKDYYLSQTIYIGGGMKSFLTRHSKEIVMQEVKDLLWSEWTPKSK